MLYYCILFLFVFVDLFIIAKLLVFFGGVLIKGFLQLQIVYVVALWPTLADARPSGLMETRIQTA